MVCKLAQVQSYCCIHYHNTGPVMVCDQHRLRITILQFDLCSHVIVASYRQKLVKTIQVCLNVLFATCSTSPVWVISTLLQDEWYYLSWNYLHLLDWTWGHHVLGAGMCWQDCPFNWPINSACNLKHVCADSSVVSAGSVCSSNCLSPWVQFFFKISKWNVPCSGSYLIRKDIQSQNLR
jgi:hypothetical protein